MTRKMSVLWMLALVGMMGFAAATAFGSATPVGSLVGSKGAILDGQEPLPHTTLLSGDNLRVSNGLAVVTFDQGNRMLLGSNTDASFLQEADGVTVSMARGNISLYHPLASRTFRVRIGDVTVTPVKGYRTLGEIAVVNGLLLMVTAKDGTLEVERAGTTEKVSKGRTITIATTAARSQTSSPTGNRHIKHLHISISPKTVLILGGAAEAAGTITAIVLAQSHAPSVSPVMPTP